MATNIVELNAWRHHLDMGEKGVKRNLTNLMVHLRFLPDLGQKIRFNEQTQSPEWKGRKLEDHDFIDIRLTIEKAGFQPNESDVRPGVMRLAHENRYNPIADYLAGLEWDGIDRIDHWMVRLLGSPKDEFVRLVSSKSLIAAVARVMKPGCQVDTMVVLEGPQGIRKSSAIQELFSTEYAFEIVSGFENHRALANSMIGAWAVELAEFVAVTKSNPATVKGLISMRHDRVILPYGRSLTDLPRRVTFWGTINPDDAGYLGDTTGNRRYWPVPVTKVDIEGIRNHRDQMWAEAFRRYKENERWWLEGDEDALSSANTEQREDMDPWVEVLRDKMMSVDHITATDAMSKIGVPFERMDKRTQMRTTNALKKIGFIKTEPKDANRKTYVLWVRKTE